MKGNQISGPGRQVTYTSFDLPKRIVDGQGDTALAYDGLMQRVLKRGPDGTVISLGGLYEKRVNAAGEVSHVFYVQGQGRPVAEVVWRESAGTVVWFCPA